MQDASAAEGGVEQSDDERLRQLLAVEQRLQDRVRAAKEEAARRVTAARAAREQRLVAARDAAEQANAARAREEGVAHQEALATIERDHRTVLAAMTSLSDEQVDELARWALARVIDAGGEPA